MKEKENLLDGHGKARRETARRRKSEWKVNLDVRNSSHHHHHQFFKCGLNNTVTATTPKTVC